MTLEQSEIFSLIDTSVRYIRQGQQGFSSMSLIRITGEFSRMSNSLSQEKLKELSPLFDIIQDAQQRQDMMYVADILEYEVVRVLRS